MLVCFFKAKAIVSIARNLKSFASKTHIIIYQEPVRGVSFSGDPGELGLAGIPFEYEGDY